MLLVASIRSATAETIECEGRIPGDHPTAEAGRAPAILGLEMGAQAAGLHGALQSQGTAAEGAPEGSPEAPRLGYLVGIRQARFVEPFLPVDRPLRISARAAGSLASLALFEVQIFQEGTREPLVQGVVSTYAL
jgi:predicted hotdog family 3-hydroxylacyl-ACP dehydratase